MVEREDLRPASVPYGDWAGTAAADGDMVKGTDLYTSAGLSRDDWFILAIDIDASATGPDHVYVYAIDRRRTQARDFNSAKDLEAREGSIPVTSILVHGLSQRDIINCMKHYSVQLRLRGFESSQMHIVDRADSPPQD